MSAVLPAASARVPDRSAALDRAIVNAPPLSATVRLEASRARLRSALMEIAHPAPRPSIFDGLGGVKAQILGQLKSLPGAALVLETVESWWAQHPLHAAGVIAEEASRTFILPAARKNPYALIAGSLVVGALLVASRPWKWLLRPALFVGLVPQLAAHALQRLPIDSWMSMLGSLFPGKADASKATSPASASDSGKEEARTPPL